MHALKKMRTDSRWVTASSFTDFTASWTTWITIFHVAATNHGLFVVDEPTKLSRSVSSSVTFRLFPRRRLRRCFDLACPQCSCRRIVWRMLVNIFARLRTRFLKEKYSVVHTTIEIIADTDPEESACLSHRLHLLFLKNQSGLHAAQRAPLWPSLQLKAVAGVEMFDTLMR